MIRNEDVKDMTPKLIKDLGMRFISDKSRQRVRYRLYECQYCGREFEAVMYGVHSGDVRSCGCLVGGLITHGLTQHRFYNTWCSMKHRCYNIKRQEYKWYGGRGITVCEEWLDVRNFIAWCEMTHPNTEGVSLDRIDNDKGYSPENCRWTTKTTQNINQRMQKNNTSGFVGITWHTFSNRWRVRININRQRVNIGSFKTKEEAVLARDNYIIENKLPHKLSTDYIKEIK